MKIILLTILLVLTFGCDNGNAQKSNDNTQTAENTTRYPQIYKLPSGTEIKVNNVIKMDFPNSDSALVMNYETKIPIEDMENLRKEVDEIWSIFQKDVETAELKAGVIRASHFENEGMIRDGKVYGFVFIKNDKGRWQLKESSKNNK
jgi:hypothetical protein